MDATPRPKIESRGIRQKGERNMALEPCRNCGKKQFNTSSRKCHACHAALRKDGTLVNVPDGYFLDEYGNLRSTNEYEISDGKLQVKYQLYFGTRQGDTARGVPEASNSAKMRPSGEAFLQLRRGLRSMRIHEIRRYFIWICKANAT